MAKEKMWKCLEKAAKLLSNKGAWAQGLLHVEKGEVARESPTGREIIATYEEGAFCLMGAIHHVCPNRYEDDIAEALGFYSIDYEGNKYGDKYKLYEWNDDEKRKKKDVITRLMKYSTKLKAEDE